jgi:hypothetical protein
LCALKKNTIRFLFVLFFELGFPYVAQVGLELMILLPQLLRNGIKGVHHHTQLLFAAFFLVELGFGLSSFALAKQNRYSYHLSHTSSPFFSGYFGDGVS